MVENKLNIVFCIENDETADRLSLTVSSLSQCSKFEEYFANLEGLRQYLQKGNYVLNPIKP